ncbi:cystin-1 [Porphyrio hochstetteri]
MGSGISRRRRGAAAAASAAVPAGGAAADRELLETMLAECEEAVALPAPGHRTPAAGGMSPPWDAGRCGQTAAGGGGAGPPPEQAALSTRSPPGPENDTADCHRCPQRNSKKPSGQSTVSYDYSEEELMASIEQEYCR